MNQKEPTKVEVMGEKSVFETLNKIDVSKFVGKKGNFNYLPWSDAVRILKTEYPNSTWEVHEFIDERGVSMPYMDTPCGHFVKVTVTVEELEMTHTHPVLDYRNNPIEKPNSYEVNTAIARCLTKAIALHGLGLYVYAGEDLPIDVLPGEDLPEPATSPKPKAEQPKEAMLSDTQRKGIEEALTFKDKELSDTVKDYLLQKFQTDDLLDLIKRDPPVVTRELAERILNQWNDEPE